MTTIPQYQRLVAQGENTFIVGTRVSIQQIYYWRKCGMDWPRILEIATSLTHADVQEASVFIAEHETELAEQSMRIDVRIEQEQSEFRRKFPEIFELDNQLPEERRARLWAKLQKRRMEANGANHPGG